MEVGESHVKYKCDLIDYLEEISDFIITLPTLSLIILINVSLRPGRRESREQHLVHSFCCSTTHENVLPRLMLI